MIKLRFLTYIALLLIVTGLCHAVPVRKDTITVIQQDGSSLMLIYQGDESGTFFTNRDGDIMEKGKDGIWRKALALDLPAPRRYLLSAQPGSYQTEDFPVKGSPRCLVALVDFPDRKFIAEDKDIVRMFNERYNKKGYSDSVTFKGETFQGASGSVRDYFEAQSFGLFTPQFDIIGPIHASNGYAYYGKNSSRTAGDDSNATKLVREVCDSIISKSLADMLLYDNNSDGQVDMLAIVFAGRGENYNGSDPNTIWPHQYDISLSGVEGLTRVNYLLTCELFWNSDDILDGIGTFCHEFSHVLGLPDFYNTSTGDSDCLGAWSLMDYGIYDNLGFAPAGYTAFERYSLGWMEIPNADANGRYVLENLANKADAYRLNTDDDDKFIILENHQKEGWFKYQKDSGLLVTSVSYKKFNWLRNSVNVSSWNYAVIPADNKTGVGNETNDLYPYQEKDSISIFSTPALKVYDGDYISIPVTDISDSEGIVSFTLGRRGTIDDIRALNTTGKADEPILVFDLSGKPVGTFRNDIPLSQLPLPPGIWLVKKDGVTKKVRL